MAKQITLYAARICPYAHRVEISLREAGLPFERYEINLWNKPEWYASKVNPASKVPAIAYGGPKVPLDQPSPESEKITESLVLTEFVADLSDSLRPRDPVLRAKARFFVETFTTKWLPAWYAAMNKGESPDGTLAGLEAIQELLPAEGYAVGEWSIADAAVAPFLARLEAALKYDLGGFPEGTGKKAFETLQTDPKFERIRKYSADVQARKSFQDSYDEEALLRAFEYRYPGRGRAKPAAKA